MCDRQPPHQRNERILKERIEDRIAHLRDLNSGLAVLCTQLIQVGAGDPRKAAQNRQCTEILQFSDEIGVSTTRALSLIAPIRAAKGGGKGGK